MSRTRKTSSTPSPSTPSPPPWYGSEWAPPGSWYHVEPDHRAAFVEVAPGAELPAEFARAFKTDPPEAWWVAGSLPPLPDGVRVAERHRGLTPPVQAGARPRVSDGTPHDWARLSFADNLAGRTAWAFLGARNAAAARARRGAESARLAAGLVRRCPCGEQVGPGSALLAGRLSLCAACWAAAPTVLGQLFAEQLLPDGRSRGELLAPAIRQAVAESRRMDLRAPNAPAAALTVPQVGWQHEEPPAPRAG